MYSRQYQLWPANQYQSPNVTQVVTQQSAPVQPSYQRNVSAYQDTSQVAGWDTVPYGGGHASQVQRQNVQHQPSLTQGQPTRQLSEVPQQQQSYSGQSYQGQSYYDSENYQQEGWVNTSDQYATSHSQQQYNTDYSHYNQSNTTYDMNQGGQSVNTSSYDQHQHQHQGNYSQADTYNENGLNSGYESPLKVLEQRRTSEPSYNVQPTSLYSNKIRTINQYEPKNEYQDFRRPAPVKDDPNIPPDIKARFLTNHCKMCDTKLNSRGQSQMHYEGKPHAKKLRSILDQRLGITREDPATPPLTTATTSGTYNRGVAPAPVAPKILTASSGMDLPMGFVGKSGSLKGAPSEAATPKKVVTSFGVLKGFVASSTGNLSTGLPNLDPEGSNSGSLMMRNSGIKTGLGFVSPNKKKNKKKKKRSADEPAEDYLDSSLEPKKARCTQATSVPFDVAFCDD